MLLCYIRSPYNAIDFRGMRCVTSAGSADQSVIKRTHTGSDQECHDDSSHPMTHHDDSSPPYKRLILDSTAQYMYKRLFVQGESSDATIHCLDKDWQLHRIVLCQSKYFECLLNGSWIESNDKIINIDIPDTAITESGLRIAFGSLYCGEVDIPPSEVLSVLAAATLFQLDGLLSLCFGVMRNNLSETTFTQYYNAATLYVHAGLAEQCVKWLQRSLMLTTNISILKSVTSDLMVQVISDGNFFVRDHEIEVYFHLKKWMFLRSNPEWDGQADDLLKAADDYLERHTQKCPFLETDAGQKFIPAFKCLRLQSIVGARDSWLKVEHDNVIPKQWLNDVCLSQYRSIIEIEQNPSSRPLTSVSEDIFNRASMRFCLIRKTPANDTEYWCWENYNFGIEPVFKFSNNLLKMKRNLKLGQSHR